MPMSMEPPDVRAHGGTHANNEMHGPLQCGDSGVPKTEGPAIRCTKSVATAVIQHKHAKQTEPALLVVAKETPPRPIRVGWVQPRAGGPIGLP